MVKMCGQNPFSLKTQKPSPAYANEGFTFLTSRFPLRLRTLIQEFRKHGAPYYKIKKSLVELKSLTKVLLF